MSLRKGSPAPCIRSQAEYGGRAYEGNRVQGAKDEAQAVVPKLDIKKHGTGLDLSGKQLSQR